MIKCCIDKIKEIFKLKNNSSDRYKVAFILKNEIETIFDKRLEIENFFITLLEENEILERLEILSSNTYSNNHKIQLQEK